MNEDDWEEMQERARARVIVKARTSERGILFLAEDGTWVKDHTIAHRFQSADTFSHPGAGEYWYWADISGWNPVGGYVPPPVWE